MGQVGNTNGGSITARWPNVSLVWNELYDDWQFLFLCAKQTNTNQSKKEPNGTVILPPLVFPGQVYQWTEIVPKNLVAGIIPSLTFALPFREFIWLVKWKRPVLVGLISESSAANIDSFWEVKTKNNCFLSSWPPSYTFVLDKPL